MTDLEYAILRVFEAFGRWQSECLAAVSGASITGPENVLLHVVAMKGRAKTIHDVMLLTNRQDTPNVQYGLRKLMKLGFMKKARLRARRRFLSNDRKGQESLQGLRRFAEETAPARGKRRVEIRIDEQKMLFASRDARKNLCYRRPRSGDVLSTLAPGLTTARSRRRSRSAALSVQQFQIRFSIESQFNRQCGFIPGGYTGGVPLAARTSPAR